MSPFLKNFLKPRATASGAAKVADALIAAANEALATRDLGTAARLYRQAIASDPSRAVAYYKLGNIQKQLGLLPEALISYDAAIERDGTLMQAFCNRGVLCHQMGKLQAAEESLKRAIALNPRDAVSHYNHALLLQDLSRWQEGLESYELAIKWNPTFDDAQYNRALLLLSLGDFATGWPAFESRWNVADRLSIGELRQFPQPLWLGKQPIAGRRLLLHSEGGLGDTIQFSRYATLCASLGAEVYLQVQGALVRLLRSLAGVNKVFESGVTPPPFDLHCPLMSLPLACHTTLESIPATAGYLSADTDRVAHWRARLGGKSRPRVGLAWSGNPNNWIDNRRSLRLSELLPHLPDTCDYYCLQTEIREEDSASLAGSTIVSFPAHELDFVNTAALCENLDVVISVDTSLAHLSGALNRPTWTLLARSADWRWLHQGSESPWYRSVRLYRQSATNEWSEVLQRVARDLTTTFLG